jgi:Group II intron, maturase-specific domain
MSLHNKTKSDSVRVNQGEDALSKSQSEQKSGCNREGHQVPWLLLLPIGRGKSATDTPKSVTKMKTRIKQLTSRSNGWGNQRRKEALSQYIKGWMQYFRLADMRNLMDHAYCFPDPAGVILIPNRFSLNIKL